MPSFNDLTNKKFNRWTVLYQSKKNNHNQITWYCRCECGIEREVKGGHLVNGTSKSCGCYNRDLHRQICIERNTTHGMTRTRLYKIWDGMKNRCLTKTSNTYKKYGAKGITICDRWRDFKNFYDDMGHPPTDKHTIDRIDPYGNYEPSNCRWALMKAQQNNRTNNHLLTCNGVTKTLQQWADETGIHYKTILSRINRSGWSIERTLSEKPIIGRNQSYGKNLVTYNGKSQTIKEWAKEIGIKQSTLQNRLNRYKWPVERSITEELVKGRPR